MITERRQIVFANSQLADALVEFDRERTKRFPPKKFVTCTVFDEKPVRATLVFRDPSGDQDPGAKDSSFEIDANHLAAVLLWRCMKQQIPIPKRAKKVLRASGDGVSLNFSLVHDEADAKVLETA